jgi:hypothetical protein
VSCGCFGGGVEVLSGGFAAAVFDLLALPHEVKGCWIRHVPVSRSLFFNEKVYELSDVMLVLYHL